MTAPPPAASEAGRPATLPEPRLVALATCALAGLLVLWLPLAMLQEVDAQLAFTTPAALWRDISLLLLLLGAAPALVLALLARAGGELAGLVGGAALRRRVSWALLVVPSAWLVAWQTSRSLRLWLQVTTGLQIGVGPHTRIIGIALLLTLVLFVWWRFGAARAGRQAIQLLQALRGPALTLLAAAVTTLVLAPPLWQPGPTPRPAAVAAPGTAPDIVLISIDALAAGDAAVCGDGPTPMPRLRAFATGATCFDRLYAGSNFTTPTTSTIETGVLPWTHFAGQIAAKVLPPLQDQTLSQRLREAGYTTHFITDNLLASPRHHGTWRGYDDARYARSSLLRNRLRAMLTVWPDSQLPLLVDTVISFIGALDVYWLGERNPYQTEQAYDQVPAMLAASAGPAFVWVHTMPPHAPYLPPPAFKHRLLPAGELDRWSQLLEENMPYGPRAQPLVDKHRLRYRESIMGADDALGRLLDTLQRAGRLDRALVVITADHGESFERRFIGHAGPLLHDAVTHIPLVVKLPGQREGLRIAQPVSQADLAPTLLELAGARALERAEGLSLQPLLRGLAQAARPVFTMTLERQSRFQPLGAGRYAVIDGPHKLIWPADGSAVELYDLQRDPHEQHNLAAGEPALAARLTSLLRMRLDRAEQARRAWRDSLR